MLSLTPPAAGRYRAPGCGLASAGRAWKVAWWASAFSSRVWNCVALDLDGAELLQVLGDELRVEQREAAVDQAGAQIDERHLAGVALGGEHALAEEGAVQRHAVEAADQLAVRPRLDRVAVAGVEQVAVERPDLAVDPGGAAAGPRGGAAVDHALEVGVDPHLEHALADGARQALGHVHLVEQQDAALLRLDPVERRIVGALGHREDAAGIGLEQHLRRDLDDDVVARRHLPLLALCRAETGAGTQCHHRLYARIMVFADTFPANGCRRGRWRCRAAAPGRRTAGWSSRCRRPRTPTGTA